MPTNHPKLSAKNAEGDTRPFTRPDFVRLVQKASTTTFSEAFASIAGKIKFPEGGWPRLAARITANPAAPRFVVSKRGHHGRWYQAAFLSSLRDLVSSLLTYPGLTLRLRSGQAGAKLCRGLAQTCPPRALPRTRLPHASRGSKRGHDAADSREIFPEAQALPQLFPPASIAKCSAVTGTASHSCYYVAHAQPAPSILRCGLLGLHHTCYQPVAVAR